MRSDHRILGVAVPMFGRVTSSQYRRLRTLPTSSLEIRGEDEDEGLGQSAVRDSITFPSSLAKERCPVPRTALKVPAIRKNDPWPRS